MIDQQRLSAEAAALGAPLTPAQLSLLDRYAEAVVCKNEVMNLTAITEPREVEIKHLLDSLACSACPEVRGRIVDIGTGAGFPGAVLKIADPARELTLVDATGKKLTFIDETCAALGLHLTTVHGRAEELTRGAQFREAFDCAVARAVANLAALAEYCLPFVRVGGFFVAMKGPEAEAELAAAQRAVRELGGRPERIDCVTLPDGSERVLVVCKKISQTPAKYPRSGKNITKKPLV